MTLVAFSVGYVAAQAGVSPGTVRNWIAKGYVKAFQLPSGHRRIPEAEVERLLGQMFQFGAPVEEEAAPRVRARPVSPDEDWGP